MALYVERPRPVGATLNTPSARQISDAAGLKDAVMPFGDNQTGRHAHTVLWDFVKKVRKNGLCLHTKLLT